MAEQSVLHKRSVAIIDGNPKLPSSSQLEYGEIAINYAKGVETISLKNNENEIVEFKTKNYFENKIKENEEFISASLNDLNIKIESKLDASSLNEYAKTTDLDSHIEKIASVSEAGHIKIGTTVNDAAAGNHNHDASYAPKNEVNAITNTINNHIDTKSSASRLGHVKVGDFLSADENGTLSIKTGTSEDTVAVGNHTHDNYSSLMHNHGKLILSGDVTGETTITSGTDDMTMDVTINGYEHNHDDLYYTETEIDDKLNNKQNVISDLETIRSGATLGATALQSIPSEYVTETNLNNKGYLSENDLTFANDSDINNLFS